MNKIFLALLVIAAGVAFGWYYMKGNVPGITNGMPLPGSPESKVTEKVVNASVSYTDNGFSPKQMTVKIGTTVTFINESSTKMWVASDVHPTHQLLPGFDELTAVGKGTSYQYIFTKIGTWSYHNHAKSTDDAMVVVTP